MPACDWLFLCGRPFLPAVGNPFDAGLGGTEQAIIHLTGALAARGHDVRVHGGSAVSRRLGGVAWLPPGEAPAASVRVAVNDARLLGGGRGGGVPLLWFHNEAELLREWRKGRLPALLRHRPAAVFIGSGQARGAAALIGPRARRVIPYGLPPAVLACPPGPALRAQVAVFTSQAYRGLREVIAAWRSFVLPACPAARLTAYVGSGDVATYAALATDLPGVAVRPRIGNTAMLAVLQDARVLIAPGHRSETFCLAAAEAVAMGVPVVTLGIGSLKERVADGRTGFVARNWPELGARTARLLQDDALWAEQHAHGVATRQGSDWDSVAARWESYAGEQIATPRAHAAA